MAYMLCVFATFGTLAIISRKHFSKYKGVRGLFLSIAETVLELVPLQLPEGRIKKYIRKTKVISERQVQNHTRTFIVECTSILLISLFVSGISAYLTSFMNQNDRSRIISRPDYDGQIKKISLYLEDTNEKTEILLDVAPIEYSVQEFNRMANKSSKQIEVDMLLDNASAKEVRSDLYFPQIDENGFDIKWESDCPEIVSSWGKVYTEKVGVDGQIVNLKYTISYLDYEVTYETQVSVLSNKQVSGFDVEIDELERLEKKSRNMPEIELPEEINGTKVLLVSSTKNIALRVYIFGILIGAVIVVYRISLLGRAAKERDDFLLRVFPEFVNRISLYLESGMTVRAAIKQYSYDCDTSNILKQEIDYTINMLETGIEETSCYEQLGFRLGLPCYYRLFSDIAQNLRMGGRDLLKLMRASLITAREVKVEYVRKKGEQASTKLLLPMGLLLLVVMAIVIAPAIMTY